MAHVTRKSGSEGPRHDPYGYEEWHVKLNGSNVTLHMGLADYVKVDGKRIATNYPVEAFERLIGCTVQALEKAYWRKHNTCPCGCHETMSANGYPGETLNVCVRCGEIVSADQDMSVIE